MKLNSTALCKINKLSGFSILELLIALILLSGGMLGAAFLQNTAMRYGQESYHRSQANILMNEVADGMRTLKAIPTSTAVVEKYTNPSYITATSECQSESPDDTGGAITTSTAEEFAENNTICLFKKAETTLPNGTAQITVNTDPNFIDISVFWSDRGMTEQANLSNDDIAVVEDTALLLNDATTCHAKTNRRWSTGAGKNAEPILDWPFNNGPTGGTCLIQHTYSIRI